MRRKVLQDIANTLCHMVVGWRMGDDWERIAALPDGALVFDLLAGEVAHTTTGKIDLWVAGELAAWLRHRVQVEAIDPSRLLRAALTASFRAQRAGSKAKKLVSFDIECRSELQTDERSYEGSLIERHVYHQRVAA